MPSCAACCQSAAQAAVHQHKQHSHRSYAWTDPAAVQPAAEAQPGSGPADTPTALLQHLALRLEKGSPMHTRIMDLKEGLFQIGEPFQSQNHYR